MSEEKKFHEMYDKLMSYENAIHEKNQKRIKIGIKCIWIIPLIFLVMLFITGSNKIVFLTLWIASLFGIAVYLIWIEYTDYELQKKMNEIGGRDEGDIDGLISTSNVELVEEHLAQAQERVEEHIQAATESVSEKRAAVQERVSERKAQAQERIGEKKKAASEIIEKRRNSDD